MARLFWIVIGFLLGVLSAGLSTMVLYLWFFSPIRIVERVLGWDLPRNISVISRCDDRDGFFGQGSTLTIFLLPTNYTETILRACPSGFKRGTLEQSGIPERDSGILADAAVCFLTKEDLSRQDTIVFAKEKLLHLRIDR